jgi:2-amino-4-hydroxy-6-hydroxymethyldihydropteridine diphosphokinase
MKKKLTKNLTLYFKNNYPYKSYQKSNKTYIAVLGIGGNIGDTIQIFDKLFLKLRTNSHFTILKSSPILKNPPFGYTKQNDFYNAIIKLATNLPPFKLLKYLQWYEKRFKRERSFKNAPRTLDIDIIFIKKNNKNIKINTDILKIPHQFYKNRLSVTIPLEFI